MAENSIKTLTRTQKVLYCVKSGYFATQLKPAAWRVFYDWNRISTVNVLVVNTCLSACWLFRQELLVCHVNRKREKDMLKQQDMTETARVVFNELSATEPATVGEIAQNTYLSRERCQLILTQLVMAGLADYQFGCYRRLPQWRLFYLW